MQDENYCKLLLEFTRFKSSQLHGPFHLDLLLDYAQTKIFSVQYLMLLDLGELLHDKRINMSETLLEVLILQCTIDGCHKTICFLL